MADAPPIAEMEESHAESELIASVVPDRPALQDQSINADDIGTFEDLLHAIGPFGWWQAWCFFWIALSHFAIGMPNYLWFFINITPPFQCADKFDPAANISSALAENADACTNVMGETCSAFNYSPRDMITTVITDWNLVCAHQFGAQHAYLVQMIGSAISLAVVGRFADRFGRKRMMMVAQISVCITGILNSVIRSFAAFVVFRFFMGFALNLYFTPVYVLGTELTTARYRSWSGGAFWVPYSIGTTMLAVLAYWFKHWRTLHLVVSFPVLVAVVEWWALPESPRWLLVNGKIKQAEKEIRFAARLNGVTLPKDLDFDKIAQNISDEAHQQAAQHSGILTLLKHRVLLFRTILGFYWWASMAFVFWGVSFYAIQLPASAFLTNGLVAFVEIPGCLASATILTFLPRRPSFIILILLTGTCLIILPWLPKSVAPLIITLALIGKAGALAAWSVQVLFYAELFPTTVRSSAMAIASSGAAIGAICAGYIAGVSVAWPHLYWLPTIIMGAVTVPAALFMLLTPETSGRLLPDHVEQVVRVDAAASLMHESGLEFRRDTHDAKPVFSRGPSKVF